MFFKNDKIIGLFINYEKEYLKLPFILVENENQNSEIWINFCLCDWNRSCSVLFEHHLLRNFESTSSMGFKWHVKNQQLYC